MLPASLRIGVDRSGGDQLQGSDRVVTGQAPWSISRKKCHTGPSCERDHLLVAPDPP